jgi:putative hemolysin
VSDAEYLLDGDLSVRSWADLFEQDLPARAGRYATVAGLVTWLLGRVPRMGDSVRWRNLEFAVEEVHKRRVTRVRLRLLPEEDEAAGDEADREFYEYPDEDF